LHIDLLSNIGLALIVATVFAFLAKILKQPLLLAYLVAGVVIGPEIGFSWVHDKESVELISEIGLILLLFMIGLEIDLKKLLREGRALIITGIAQFLVCVALGVGFAPIFGFGLGGGKFDAIYLAVSLALSSTMIVVKLLYDKFELMTLPGRLTLGVLVFQDIWAIVFLAFQPSLQRPEVTVLFDSLVKGVGLVLISLALSRYVLPYLFSLVAKIPELLLISAIAWCFLVSGAADTIGLSREMGALIAGVSMSTFPYNVDVIAKVTNIRDFFVTLFFVALGMKIPMPTLALLGCAMGASFFLIASRFLSVFPVLYLLRHGLRASLIPSINLAQMSEFSLVIASIGLSLQHIGSNLVGILTFVFAITSVASTYLITYNHEIQAGIGALLKRLGLKDIGQEFPVAERRQQRAVVFLGFFRDASSILHEFELQSSDGAAHPILKQIVVIDFNPLVYQELNRRSIRCIYGDIASMDTLHHAQIHSPRLVVSTITDAILKGTNNLRLMRQARRLWPEAKVIVASDTIKAALELYQEGADFVYIPRLRSAREMAELLSLTDEERLGPIRDREIEHLKTRKEVLP